MSWKGGLDLPTDPTTLIEIISKIIIRNGSGSRSTKVDVTKEQRSNKFSTLSKTSIFYYLRDSSSLLEIHGFGYKLKHILRMKIVQKEI